MEKIISVLLGASILFGILTASVLAQTTDIPSGEELIQLLLQKIEELKVKIAELKVKIEALKQAKPGTLKLVRQLRIGMSGEDVKLLQEVLATDPEIYPEGLVTGYFGPLTRNAVKRLQKIAGFVQVGQVGPKTFSKINELLEEGAGKSGKVPPGLLIAPGIRKKLSGLVFEPLPGQQLPPGIAKKIATTTPAVDGVTPQVEGVIF